MRYVIVLALLLAIFAFACDGGEEETGGIEGFRAFAEQIEAAVQGGDTSFFSDAAILSTYTCTDQVAEFSVCKGQTTGEEVQGFWFGYAPGEGEQLATLDEYETDLRDWFSQTAEVASDEYGPGNASLYAIAHGTVVDEDAYVAIVTSIHGTEDLVRTVRLFRWQFQDGSWRHTSLLETGASIDEFLSESGPAGYIEWERWDGVGP